MNAHSTFDQVWSLLKPPALSYCDMLADNIRIYLGPERIIRSVGRVQSDLHPEHGYLLSTKKTLEAIDINGTHYRITVERCDELPAAIIPTDSTLTDEENPHEVRT